MGRPAINTALNSTFHPLTAPAAAAAGMAKDKYNANGDIATWGSDMLNGNTTTKEFQKNLAILDSLDTLVCCNGVCESGEIGLAATCSLGAGNCTACNVANATTPCICPDAAGGDCTSAQIGAGPAGLGGGGCGNQAMYNNNGTAGGGTPAADSYLPLATLLADDELFLDTTKTTCTFYLAVEFGVLVSGNSTCGGRALDYDVIDYSLSMLTLGALKGFDLQLQPRFHDGAGPHTDYLSTFPSLGPPH